MEFKNYLYLFQMNRKDRKVGFCVVDVKKSSQQFLIRPSQLTCQSLNP